MTATVSDDLTILLDGPNQWPQYHNYRPLSLDHPEIRLLYFSVDDISGTLHGRFKQVSLDDEQVHYEAVSYCWGPPSRQRSICIEGQNVLIRSSLHNFLTILCNQHGGQTLPVWVDSLCINQRDTNERNRQVALMGRIYKDAKQVLVWLGDFSSDADFFFLFLQNHQNPKIATSVHQVWLEQKARESVEDVMKRPYWKHLWIVQELVLAERVQVWCGDRHTTWDLLLYGLQHLFPLRQSTRSPSTTYATPGNDPSDHPPTETVAQFRGFLHSIRPRTPESSETSAATYRKSQTVLERLSQFSSQRCYEPKDPVYAVLSIASDGSHLNVNCDKTVMELVFEVVMLTWLPQLSTDAYATIPDISELESITSRVCSVLDFWSSPLSLHKIDSSRTISLGPTPNIARVADFSRYWEPYSTERSICRLYNTHPGRIESKCPLTEIGTCFYPHSPTEWPRQNDWIVSCYCLGSSIFVVCREKGSFARRWRFIGVLDRRHCKAPKHTERREPMTELIAESEHIHIHVSRDATNTRRIHVEISLATFFHMALMHTFPNCTDGILLHQRGRRWPKSGMLKEPIFRNSDSTPQRNLYHHMATSREIARLQLRDACHDMGGDFIWCLEHRQSNPVDEWDELSYLYDQIGYNFIGPFTYQKKLPYPNALPGSHMYELLADLAERRSSERGRRECSPEVGLAMLIVLDQLVFQLGMMRVRDGRKASSSTQRRVARSRVFEDHWMMLGFFLLRPTMYDMEDSSGSATPYNPAKYVGKGLGEKLEQCRDQNFKVWRHYHEIKATLR